MYTKRSSLDLSIQTNRALGRIAVAVQRHTVQDRPLWKISSATLAPVVLTSELKEAIDQIASGGFSSGDQQLFRPIVDSLLGRDEYMLLADYESYVECQQKVGHAYLDPEHWTRISILNTARMGKFSSDRSIREYARNIWHVEPLNLAARPARVATNT